MSRTKLISILAAGLLAANLFLTAFILFRRPPLPPHERPRAIIIERLHFTEAQVSGYDQLIAWHRREIRKKDEQLLQLKDQLYGLLDENNPEVRDSLRSEIGKLQISIEEIHFKHFKDIEQLCNAEQKIWFKELLKDMAGIFSKPKGEPPPR